MPRVTVNLGETGPAFLELGTEPRRGSGRRDHLSLAQVGLIARTVHRAPEVMVKVLTRGGTDMAAVGRHFEYLSRKGKLEIETDDGRHLSGRGAEKALLEDWDLDLDELRPTADLRSSRHRAPKLAHKLVFSMPPGTPPQKVLEAVRSLTREEFALKHRYAMVLHTDEPHPHVHVVVKALGEDGKRLNIRKETLRTWRREFARHLRDLGVEANATNRVSRGVTRPQKINGIYWADQGGRSTHMHERISEVARELARGDLKVEPAREQILATRRAVVRGWLAVAETLEKQEEKDLAVAVRRFVQEMPAPLTEKQWIAAQLADDRPARSPPARTR